MGIAAGVLFIFLIFSVSMSKFIGDENITNLSRELKETTTINRQLDKGMQASQRQFKITDEKLDKIRGQLKAATEKKNESERVLTRLKKELEDSFIVVTEDEEADQFTTKEQRKINALEERLEAVMADRKRAKSDFEQKKDDARRKIEALAAENEEIQARLVDLEMSSLGVDSSDLGVLIEDLAAENAELQARVEEAESAVAMVEEANRKIEELTDKNAELEENLNKLRKSF